MTRKKLYICKNHERPLAIAQTSDMLAFASEGAMLAWILQRDNRPRITSMESVKAEVIYEIGTGPFEMEEERLYPLIHPVSQAYEPKKNVVQVETKRPTVSQVNATIFTDEELEIDKLLSAYSNGEVGVFFPTSLRKSEERPKDRWFSHGMFYVPGKPVASAKCWFPNDMDEADALELCLEKRILASIQTIMMPAQSRELFLVLHSPKSDVWVDSWNGESFLREEWKAFINKFACKSCGHAFGKYEHEFTSVKLKNDIVIEGKCPGCTVIKNYDSLPPVLQAKADAFIQAGSTSVQTR